MGVKDKEEREPVTRLQDIKDIIFKVASDEMEGYLLAKSYLPKDRAEFQHQRYVVIWGVIYEAGWNEEFNAYSEALKRERTMTKK